MEPEVYELHREDSLRRQMWIDQEGQSKVGAAIEAEEMNLVQLLKPKMFVDGDQWCVLYGENLQEGIGGFGKTPRLAIYDFNKQFDKNV